MIRINSQKMEKVKELLSYGDLNLSKIVFQMNYSSSTYPCLNTRLDTLVYKNIHKVDCKYRHEL